MRIIAVTTALLAGCWAGQVQAQSSPAGRELDDFMQEMMAAAHAPGLAAGIVKNNRLVWERTYGWADLENRVPMTENTIQNVGSISKTFTATAIMQLWEQGRFQLDDDVNKHLPFPVRNPRFPKDPITFRQLLTHKSSIRDGPAYEPSYACGDPTMTLKDWARACLAPGGKHYAEGACYYPWKPGTVEIPNASEAYSNVGFGLLGCLVESISGQDFATYCRASIFAPLGMNNTGWHLKEVNVATHAIPYTFLSAEFKLPEGRTFETFLPRFGKDRQSTRVGTHFAHCLYSFPNYPDGLVRTSVQQLSRYLLAYLNGGAVGGKRILKKETVEMMLSQSHHGRGLGWDEHRLRNGDIVWGHDGGDPGVATRMYFRKRDGAGVILFFNVGEPGKAMDEILERLFAEAGK